MLMEYVKKKKRREKMHTQRRYATCLQRHVKKNEEERKEPTVDNQGERVMQKRRASGPTSGAAEPMGRPAPGEAHSTPPSSRSLVCVSKSLNLPAFV